MAGNVLRSRLESAPLPRPMLPENASVSRRWKFRRNLVIFVASRNGVSQRLLADVFDRYYATVPVMTRDITDATIFVDEVHLYDPGNEIVARELSGFIR